jgi:hypothetical protein
VSDGGRTLVVCLECAGAAPRDQVAQQPDPEALVIPFTTQWAANGWVRAHRATDRGLGHDAVTVPGWPDPPVATMDAWRHIHERTS